MRPNTYGLVCRHIVASVDEEASGPSYSVAALSRALRARGADSALLSVALRAPGEGLDPAFPK